MSPYITKGSYAVMSKESCARTWQVDRSTSEEINRLADALQVYPSDLVNMLLSRAIDALETGAWSIERKPVKYSLHWGQEGSNQNQT